MGFPIAIQKRSEGFAKEERKISKITITTTTRQSSITRSSRY
jgi:hypothetical protein